MKRPEAAFGHYQPLEDGAESCLLKAGLGTASCDTTGPCGPRTKDEGERPPKVNWNAGFGYLAFWVSLVVHDRKSLDRRGTASTAHAPATSDASDERILDAEPFAWYFI